MISATEIGVRSMLPKKILKGLVQSGPFWCIILIRFSLKKVPLFIIKKITIIATHLAIMHSCYGLFCFQRNFKKHAL